MDKVNLADKLSLFSEHWRPKIVGAFDDYEIKVVKIEGDFVWHSHEGEDEVFVVLEGGFRMDFRDRSVDVTTGEMIIVPRGIEHKPYAARECHVMLIERGGVVNTGDAPAGERTAPEQPRI